MTSHDENASMIIQVKSGRVSRGDIAKLKGDMQREKAEMATLITLQTPTAPMYAEAKATGNYHIETMGKDYNRIDIVTVQEMIESGRRLDLPVAQDVLKSASRKYKPGPEHQSII
jgi:site-specific DNA-methyltransferase (adenine-specific)